MAWWAWLLVGWVVLACALAILLGSAARLIKKVEHRAADLQSPADPAMQRPPTSPRPRPPTPSPHADVPHRRSRRSG
jgi:hypothetical protein